MQSSLTYFGQRHSHELTRLRFLFVGLGLVLVFVSSFFLPVSVLLPFSTLLVLQLGLAVVLIGLESRVLTQYLMHLAAGADIATVAVVVFCTGGIAGGFASLYLWPILTTALVLGTRWVRVWGAVVLAAVSLEIAGEVAGLLVPRPPISLPFFVGLSGQGALFILLLGLVYFLARTHDAQEKEMQIRQSELLSQRENEERLRRRWEWVNDIALRIQESTTPAQIYETIGKALGALELRCAVFQWAEPGVVLRLAYTSLDEQTLHTLEQVLQLPRDKFDVPIARSASIQQAIETRTAARPQNLMHIAQAIAPSLTEAQLAAILPIGEVNRVIHVPMVVGERVPGILMVWGKNLEADDIPSLQALAHQAASAVDKATLLAQTHKRATQLTLVSDISARAASIYQAQELMDRVVAMVYQHFGYLAVTILRVDPARGDLYLAAGRGELVDRAGMGYRQSLDAGIVGYVVRMGKSYVSQNVRSDPYYVAPVGEDDIYSELAVPLHQGTDVIGALDVEASQCEAFDASDIAAMETLADQVSAALEKGKLLQSERKRAAQLALVNQVASRTARLLPVPQVLQEAVMSIQEQFGYFNTAIYMNEPAGRQVTLASVSGKLASLSSEYHQAWSEGIVGHVAETGEIYLSGDLHNDPHYVCPLPEIENRVCSELAIPLRRQDQVLGVLDIQSEHCNAFDASDIAAMETLADQLVTALDNARLYVETMNRARELQAVHQASERLVASLSVKEVCQATVQALSEIVGYQHVAIYFCEDNILRLQTQLGYAKPPTVIDLGQGIMARAVRTQQLVFVPEVESEAEFMAMMPGIQSEIAVPLLRDERVLGVLNVETLKPQTLTESDVRLLATFANHLVMVIEHGELYDHLQRRLHEAQILHRFTASLGQTRSVEALGRYALDAVTHLIPFDIAEVSLVDEASGTIYPIVLTGHRPASELLDGELRGVGHQHSLRRGKGVVGWVAEHGESVLLRDVQSDSRYIPWSPVIHSELCVPLRARDRIIGVINLEAAQCSAFDERDEQFLCTLASQLAIALVNAGLYEQTKQDAEIKAALLREVSHRVKNNLAAISGLLRLSLETTGEAREELLYETLERVDSMVLAHTLLARSGRARVDLLELGEQVLNDAVRNLAPHDTRLQVQVEGARVDIAPRQLITITLALHELATNALQHGFIEHGRTTGNLQLTVLREGPAAQLTLSDDGNGPPENFSLDSNAGIGLGLIRTLVEKDLHGIFKLERYGGWTHAHLRFAVEE